MGAHDQDTAVLRPTPQQARAIEREVETALRQHPRIVDCAVVLQGRRAGDPRPDRCTRCGIPEDHPGISLDDAGVCGLCQLYAANRDAIHAWFRDTEALRRRLRQRAAASPARHDCLLLFSGGKDSTYALYQLVELGLRVMTFTFDNGFISKTALRNVERITGELGVEHVTANRDDQNRVFLDSLTRHQSVCNGCFRSLLELSLQLARERGIPSVVTGLSRGQIIDERLAWFYQRGLFDPLEIERQLAVGRRVYHQLGGELDAEAVERVEVIDYYRYSEATKQDIQRFLQHRSPLWSRPRDTGFCSSNCLLNDVGVYVHTVERGFHNYESPTRWEVRLGHLGLAEADTELQPPANLARVKTMLARIGYTDPTEREQLGKRLAAYYVSRDPVTVEELRRAVAERLPAFLVPERWVRLDRIPRTGGVVAVRELPAPSATRFELQQSGAVAQPPSGASGTAAPAAAATFPLTPAQQAFLDRRGGTAEAAAQARALLLELAGKPDLTRIKRVVLHLLLRHDALRLRFARHDGAWRQRDAGVGGALPVVSLDLSGRDSSSEPVLLRAALARLRARLDLAAGPVLQVALINHEPRPSQLLLLLHELVADLPSWRVLLADLRTALEQTEAGVAVELPPPRSFRSWVEQAAGGTPAARRAAATGPAAPTGCLPALEGDEELGPAALYTYSSCLSADQTRRLPMRLLLDPALPVAAVASALAERLGGPTVTLDVADHAGAGQAPGRPRPVGQLSAVGTVALAPPPRGDPGDSAALVRMVREQLAAAGWPAGNGSGSAAPQVRCNHLGDLTGVVPHGTLFSQARLEGAGLTALPGIAPYLLEVDGYLRDGRLHLDWRCGASLQRRLLDAEAPQRAAAWLQRLTHTGGAAG